MKPLKALIIPLFIIGLISSCAKQETETPNSPLNGTRWVEQDLPSFAGNNHIFEFFDNNEFTLELNHWTDMLIPFQECPDIRTDYIQGTYTMSAKTFSINGQLLMPTKRPPQD